MRWMLMLLLGLSSSLATAEPLRILFVGNSLIYYNDVPRAVEALLEAEGTHPEVEVEMLAEGGATLAEHLGRDALDRTLAEFDPDVVVLQDLGPYPLCATEDATAQSRRRRLPTRSRGCARRARGRCCLRPGSVSRRARPN